MRNVRRLSLVVSMAIPAATMGCGRSEQPAVIQQGAASDVAEARRAIDALRTAYVDAANRGDVRAVASLYDDSAVFMPPGMPAATGGAAIQAAVAGTFSQVTFANGRLIPQDVTVLGEFAFETGRYASIVTPKGGMPMPDSGKYLTVLKKQSDGSWKFYRDMSNADAPPLAPAPKK